LEGRRVEIDGELFDLDDPEDKKRAVKAWLRARSRERRAGDGESGVPPAGEEGVPPGPTQGNGP